MTEDVTDELVTHSSTLAGGKSPQIVDSGRIGPSSQLDPADSEDAGERADLARNALADAQRIARTRPGSGSSSARRRRRRQNLEERGSGGYSGPGPDASDPQPIGALLADYVQERGWERPLSEARVFSDWAALVGADVAAHCAPASLANGELKVTAESTAWATQLRLLSGTLLARLAAELGPEVVASIRISGPGGPTWKHGGFSVRGARGPRDTYG